MKPRAMLSLLLGGCLLLSGCSRTAEPAASEISALSQASAVSKAEQTCLNSSTHTACLCLHRNGSMSAPALYPSINYTYSLWAAYSLTNAYYQDNVAGSGQSYSAYVAERLEQDASLKKYIDKDLKPKRLPDERVYLMLNYYPAEDDNAADPALLHLGIEKAFTLIAEDPASSEMLTRAIEADYPESTSAYEGFISVRQKTASVAVVETELAAFGGEHAKCRSAVSLDGEPEDALLGTLEMTAANVLGEPLEYSFDGKAAADLYKSLRDMHDTAPRSEADAPEDALLTVTADSTLESTYQYLGDGRWYYSDALESGCALTGGEAATDAAYLYTALSFLSDEDTGAFSVGDAYKKPRIASSDQKRSGEILYCYADDRTTRQYWFNTEDGALYYYEGSATRTDAEIGGAPYYQNTDEYEYFGNAEEAWYRPEMYDVFYPADQFEGEWEPVSLAKRLAQDYRFVGGTEVTRGSDALSCESYRSSSGSMAVLLDAGGHITAAWRYDPDGLLLITSVQDPEPVDMEELLEHARSHSDAIQKQKELDAKKTEDDWRREDLEKLGLPDLGGKVTQTGESLTESPVVQRYMTYLSGGNPFTLRWNMVGNFRCDTYVLTSDGADFYDSRIITSHDNSFDYALTEIVIGDFSYMTDDYGNFRRYPRSTEGGGKEVYYRLPDALADSDNYTFRSAYEGEVNGETYTVEEWDLNGEVCLFFCRDDRIIGYRHRVFGNLCYFYPTDYTQSTDNSLLCVPEAEPVDENQ